MTKVFDEVFRTPEFEKDLKKLLKRFRTLEDDLDIFIRNELKLYHKFVNPGSYLVVFDTHTSKLAEMGGCDRKYINNSPKEAVDEFLGENSDFEVDRQYNKLFISYSPDGYLRRKIK